METDPTRTFDNTGELPLTCNYLGSQLITYGLIGPQMFLPQIVGVVLQISTVSVAGTRFSPNPFYLALLQ